jgi:hypothetical protein
MDPRPANTPPPVPLLSCPDGKDNAASDVHACCSAMCHEKRDTAAVHPTLNLTEQQHCQAKTAAKTNELWLKRKLDPCLYPWGCYCCVTVVLTSPCLSLPFARLTAPDRPGLQWRPARAQPSSSTKQRSWSVQQSTPAIADAA